MKKLHLLLLSVTLCVFSACHNDIWDAIDGLDSRVTKLEELCKEMNTNITSLQTIVDVLQSNDFITGIVEIKKNGEVIGYTITFGKHDPITIYHGQDGKDGADGKDGQDGSANAPVIGVALDSDGVYYWTLNGEWLLDDNGNKLPVSGKDGQNGTNGSNGQDGADGKDGQDGEDGKDGADGQDGITPQLKIEDGYWYISYDNGATWTQLGKATGEDGKDGADGKDGQNGADGKDGQDGDSMFQSVTQDENYVYFTLADGTVIKIAKNSDTNDEQNPKDIINFRDLAVKSALLKLGVDTTGDGEISYGEAIAYKGELTINSDPQVLSFKEFRYFKNITSFSFYGCSNLFEFEFPTELTAINNSAFRGCSSLTHITLPSGITSIGNYAFGDCASLKTITLPDGLISIGEYAFKNCSTLVSAEIPNSVTSIGMEAFYNCPQLKSFTFPENLLDIKLFYNASYLSTIYWNAININNFYFQQYSHSSAFYGLMYSYYSDSGSNSSIKQVIIGDKVTRVPSYLCLGLLGVTEVDIPNSVIGIGNSAFYGCGNLTSLTIGDNVKIIDSYAFSNCNKLTTITIPKSVAEIGVCAFTDRNYYNTGPNKIYCEAINPPVMINGKPFNKNAVIYVPRASVDEYRVIWSDYADRIVGYDFE